MATQTTPTSPRAWRPDIQAFNASDVVPDALLNLTATVVGTVEGDEPAVRVPFVLDDGVAGFVPEGDVIPDAEQQFSEVVVSTGKLAALGKYSYETLQQPEAARLVTESLSRSIVRQANAAYLGNPSGSNEPVGLLNIAGVVDGGVVADNLDAVVDAVSHIESDFGTASHLIAAPDAWATLSKLKDEDTSNRSLIGAGTAAAERALLGLPVHVSNAAPEGSVIVADRRAVVAAVGQVRTARSEDAFFGSDVVGIRVTWRVGWAVQRPNRVVRLSTTATP